MTSLYIVLFLALFCKGTSSDSVSDCDITRANRVGTGWGGMSPAECYHYGWCWDASLPNVAWCYKPRPLASECDISRPDRVGTGWGGMSPKDCYDLGNCWDQSVANVAWCYKKRPAAPAPAPAAAGSNLVAGNLARPPATFTTYPGFDIQGPNLSTPELPTIQACSDKCGRNRKCVAFVYYLDNQQCALKSDVTSFDDVGDEDIIAGLSQYVSVVQD